MNQPQFSRIYVTVFALLAFAGFTLGGFALAGELGQMDDPSDCGKKATQVNPPADASVAVAPSSVPAPTAGQAK